jgi:formate-dependent nitrite reductase membrane component NrfD
MLSLVGLSTVMQWNLTGRLALWGTAVFAMVAAVYTAFLFAQGKGRDFWQSPLLPLHMLVQSLMAGAAASLLIAWFLPTTVEWASFLRVLLQGSIILNIVLVVLELFTRHATEDAGRAARMIVDGRFRTTFWIGAIALGHVIPFVVLWNSVTSLWPLAAVFALIGIYLMDHIWVRAPQLVPLS